MAFPERLALKMEENLIGSVGWDEVLKDYNLALLAMLIDSICLHGREVAPLA